MHTYALVNESIRRAQNLVPLSTEKPDVTSKSFAFTTKNDVPLFYVSASDGTNVVKLFTQAVKAATDYKKNPVDIEDQILEELDNF